MKRKGAFCIKDKIVAKANRVLNNDTLKEFWRGCSFGTSEIAFEDTDSLTFCIGEAKQAPIEKGEYSICVEESGVCVSAKTEIGLIHGFVSLARKMRMDQEQTVIDSIQTSESADISMRIAHLCVFPETKKVEIEKFVRFCGALRYTHVILEFWGMLQFDCLKELGWSHAFSKSEIREVVGQAKDFGIEIIPMFNHWGHASASRVVHGKHVVLDQNPTLQYYFSDTGWCWDYRNPRTIQLLKEIRAELMELCGQGKYFHIGCDEAYGFDFSEKEMSDFCEYVNTITEELAKVGRRPLMWGDMLIAKHEEFDNRNHYSCNSRSLETEKYFLSNLDRRIMIADWQYDSPVYPVQTSKVFAEAGFDVIVCPWDHGTRESDACLKTVKDGLAGIMHTTWHTLVSGYQMVYYLGEGCWKEDEAKDMMGLYTKAAALMRKVHFADGDYQKAGWSEKEIVG